MTLILTSREIRDNGNIKGYVAECNGVSIGPTFHSPLCKLARALIEADPASAEMPWQLVHNGKPALTGKRLAWLAANDVDERSGARFVKQVPFALKAPKSLRHSLTGGDLAVSGSQVAKTEDGPA